MDHPIPMDRSALKAPMNQLDQSNLMGQYHQLHRLLQLHLWVRSILMGQWLQLHRLHQLFRQFLVDQMGHYRRLHRLLQLHLWVRSILMGQ